MNHSTQFKALGFDVPTAQYPFYHLRVRPDEAPAQDLHIERIRVDGERSRDFWVYREGRPTPLGNRIDAGAPAEIVVRVDWANNSTHRVELDLAEYPDTFALEATAPEWGGRWHGDWAYYASVVLTETAGQPRIKEPVHLLLSIYADRLSDPAREIRVVGIDPVSSTPHETPCQVTNPSTYDAFSDDFNQPTTTVEVAFLADVPMHGAKVYLIFYGNPDTPAPAFSTDLAVSGEGLAFTVENDHYRARLHERAGTLDDVMLKENGGILFDHHIENNGAIHWNPGVYTRGRRWAHQSDWDPPPQALALGGPVFFMTRRKGPLPDYPEVHCTVSYTFYAHQPYIMMESSIDVTQAIDVHALRNGEIVFNHKLVRAFAWKQRDGSVAHTRINETPKSPRLGAYMPPDVPWWAFYNQDVAGGFAAINLDLVNIQREQYMHHWEPYTYLYWSDDLIYCCRPLLYTFATGPWNNPQRMVHLPRHSTYYERMAFYPFRLGKNGAPFDPVERLHRQLTCPLDVSAVHYDIDARAPDGWARPAWLERDDYTRKLDPQIPGG